MVLAQFLSPSHTYLTMKFRQNRTSTPWFFDLLISDIPAAIYNALAILYHGSSDGAFGRAIHDRVDLRKIHAVKVNISHTSCKFLSEDYEFNLVCYSKGLAHSIWEPSCREKKKELKCLIRRVPFNKEQSLVARRLIDELFIKKDYKVYFAKFDESISPDYCVPLSYHDQLFHLFEMYIMRNPIEFPLVRSLFKVQGIDMAERKFASYHTARDEQVVIYTQKNPAGH